MTDGNLTTEKYENMLRDDCVGNTDYYWSKL